MRRLLGIGLILFSLAISHAGISDFPRSPSLAVATVEEVWHDTSRNRDVPVKIYYPAADVGRCPVIIFSHGLGGSREGYGYLGQYWAGCGYVAVHVQHAGSDEAVWKGVPLRQVAAAMRSATLDPQVALDRAMDIHFAIDRLRDLDGRPPLQGRLELSRIGVAGHSFGGWTAMAIAGEHQPMVGNILADSRVTAVIAMSAPIPKRLDTATIDRITVPVFCMTGTRDNSPIGETMAPERRLLFDRMTSPDACLLIFNGANHMTFSGRRERTPDDSRFQKLICEASTAYWDAWLRGDSAAKAWLYDGGFARLLGDAGSFETKPAHP
jgi:predicted dienelactone hydrolase